MRTSPALLSPFLVGAATVAFVAISIALSQTAHKSAGQAVENEIRRLQVELGSVDPGSVIRKTVAIANDSSVSWHAASLSSGCSCVVHSIEPYQIDPDCKGVVSVEYKAPTKATVFDETVLVQFHEEQAPRFLIQIKGVVEPWCYATPRELDFGEIDHEESAQGRRVLLKLKPGAQINTNRPLQAPEWVDVKYANDFNALHGGAESCERVALDCRPSFASDAPAGEFTGVIVFTSFANPTDKCTLPVRAIVAPSLKATPASLFLGTHKVGEQFTSVISLDGRCLPPQIEQSFVDEQIRVTHELGKLLDAKVVPTGNASKVVVECRFTMPDSACFFAGKIVVSCQGANAVIIPVAAKVAHGIGAGSATK